MLSQRHKPSDARPDRSVVVARGGAPVEFDAPAKAAAASASRPPAQSRKAEGEEKWELRFKDSDALQWELRAESEREYYAWATALQSALSRAPAGLATGAVKTLQQGYLLKKKHHPTTVMLGSLWVRRHFRLVARARVGGGAP